MNIEQKLQELNITLPPAPKPVAAYVPTVRTGRLLYVSSVLPIEDGKVAVTGKVGDEGLPLEEGQRAARLCLLNSLAAVKEALGSLSKVKRIVRLNGSIQTAGNFADHPKVLNGASELLVQIFGDAGTHSRSAVGAFSLPLNATVLLDMIVEVAE